MADISASSPIPTDSLSNSLINSLTYYEQVSKLDLSDQLDVAACFSQCKEFTEKIAEKTNKSQSLDKVDIEFIIKNVTDELNELAEAKTEVDRIDALIDAAYYCLQHLSRLSSVTIPMSTSFDVDIKENVTHVFTMFVMDEVESRLAKLSSALDPAIVVLDIVAFLFSYLNKYTLKNGKKLNANIMWNIVHLANMTKFERGHLDEKGKWCKDLTTFVPPETSLEYAFNKQLE